MVIPFDYNLLNHRRLCKRWSGTW